MKLFEDRNKTLLPQIDLLYLITRVLVFISIVWFLFYNSEIGRLESFYYPLLSIYFIHLTHFYLSVRSKLDIKLAYLASIIIDLIIVPLLLLKSGGGNNPYFLIFFLTISVAAYVLTFWTSLTIIISITGLYLFGIFYNPGSINIYDVSLKLVFYWINYIVVLYGTGHLRQSEKRLLKLLDTLNRRTSELEKSQTHLEMIYESTRILASILNISSLVKEIMKVMGKLLRYEAFGIILRDKDNNYLYRARFDGSLKSYNLKPIDIEQMDLLMKVAQQREAVIVNDISKRDDYLPLNKKSKSLMIVPVSAHKKTTGFLVAEASTAGLFNDLDEQMLVAIARSSALAFENAKLHRKTQELTIIDELTGIYNFRYFVRKLEEEKRRAARYDSALSLIMIDLDHFKKLNDTFGHESGNAVLKNMVKIIRKCIRDVDIFCRYGGEEFTVILPQTPLNTASVMSERIRKHVEQATFFSESGEMINVTVSIGLTSFPENGHSQEELVSIADQALYHAKGDGRNKVCIK